MTDMYQKRLDTLRNYMVEQDIDAVFIRMSSDLQYLTGVIRRPHNPTNQNKHGDEFYGAVIFADSGPHFIVPRMEASHYITSQTEGKPWVEDVVIIDESDDPHEVTKSVLDKAGSPQKIGVSGRLWARAMLQFQQMYPDVQMCNISEQIARMRAIKDDYETEIMQEAGDITDKVFADVVKQMRVGMTEWDIAREVERQIILHGGSGISFHTGVLVTGHDIEPVYASDEKTRITPVQPGSSIVFDFGVIYKGYVSDFGRTVFCGEPTDTLKHYHEVVMESQAKGMEAMTPGNLTAAELNEICHGVLADAGLDKYFTHRTGHCIGIDVHEPPFLFERDDTVLQEGMCMTVEPSIRVPDGPHVRVEDVVQVTPDGGLSFSNFSRELLII